MTPIPITRAIVRYEPQPLRSTNDKLMALWDGSLNAQGQWQGLRQMVEDLKANDTPWRSMFQVETTAGTLKPYSPADSEATYRMYHARAKTYEDEPSRDVHGNLIQTRLYGWSPTHYVKERITELSNSSTSEQSIDISVHAYHDDSIALGDFSARVYGPKQSNNRNPFTVCEVHSTELKEELRSQGLGTFCYRLMSHTALMLNAALFLSSDDPSDLAIPVYLRMVNMHGHTVYEGDLVTFSPYIALRTKRISAKDLNRL